MSKILDHISRMIRIHPPPPQNDPPSRELEEHDGAKWFRLFMYNGEPSDPLKRGYHLWHHDYLQSNDETLDILFTDNPARKQKIPFLCQRERIPFGPDEGLAERVAVAIRPLTDGGGFSLEFINFDVYYGVLRIRLHSDDVDIDFSRATTPMSRQGSAFDISYRQCGCTFHVHALKSVYMAEYLLPVLHIEMPVIRSYIRLVTSTGSPEGLTWGETTIRILLDETCFIEELNTLCRRLQKNLPQIMEAFSDENIEETNRLYTLEAMESGNSVGSW